MRKITLSLLIFLAAFSFANAQDNLDTTGSASSGYDKTTYLSVSALATPTFSYRTIKALDPSANDAIAESNRLDVPTLLFEVGGRINLNFAGRLRLSTGAMFSQKGYQSNLEFKDKNTGQPIEETYRSYTTYTFIEVPAYLSFAIAKDSSKTFYLFGGISAGLLQKRRFNTAAYDSVINEVFYPEDDVIKDEDVFISRGYNTTQYAIIAGVEGEFSISDHISFMVQPHFKYFFTPVQTDEQGIGKVKQVNLFTVGLSLGVNYRF